MIKTFKKWSELNPHQLSTKCSLVKSLIIGSAFVVFFLMIQVIQVFTKSSSVHKES